MARAVRGFEEEGIYHILNRGNGRGVVFSQPGDYQSFMDLLRESKQSFGIDLYAYCLMPNHFHFVAKCPGSELFSRWMQWLTTAHARRYHKYYGGSGHVWQGRFKSFLIHCDDYLISVLRYVEANPLRAGLVEFPEAWRWSSFSGRVGLCHDELLAGLPITLPSTWSEWVGRAMGESELKTIRASVKRQTPYGPSSWQGAMCSRLGIKSTLNRVGRPKRGQSQF